MSGPLVGGGIGREDYLYVIKQRALGFPDRLKGIKLAQCECDVKKVGNILYFGIGDH